MDKKIFDGDLVPVFGNRGYEGVHDLKGGQVSEGVACFWRQNRFSCLQRRSIIVAEALQSDIR